jgi:subtilase family serine protease
MDGNVTIQGEQQKTFAGATRTITYVNTTDRDKQWDKATGIFVTTQDYLQNYTVSATATATNMWSPQILGLDQTVFYAVVGVVFVVVIIAVVLAILFVRRRK